MKIMREPVRLYPTVTIGEDGLLRVMGLAVNYRCPFVMCWGLVCYLTSDTDMGVSK